MSHPITLPPGQEFRFDQIDPRRVDGDWNKKSAEKQLNDNVAATRDLAYRLYAENRRSILLVLQGMDTAGKDGTIRTVMTGVNPQSCQVVSFKAPGQEELDHDFLWRIHLYTPRRGNIGIFNRSHYEDVGVVRVHHLVPEAEWRTRYDRINDFEKLLVESGMVLIKCYLHISRDEQRERLQARLDNSTKRWKFSLGDLSERKLWKEYQLAYEEALTRCNTNHAPWYVIPSDRKWYRNLVVSQLLRETLEAMDPQLPAADPGLEGVLVE